MGDEKVLSQNVTSRCDSSLINYLNGKERVMKKITFIIIGVVLMLPGAPLAQYPAEEKG
jgi:hypothetical protein